MGIALAVFTGAFAAAALTLLSAPRTRLGRIICGLAAATVSVQLVVIIAMAVWQLVQRGWRAFSWSLAIQQGVGFSFYALPVAYLVTLTMAIPAHITFATRGWTRYWYYAILGLSLGTAPFLIVGVGVAVVEQTRTIERLVTSVDDLLPWLALGASSGLASARSHLINGCVNEGPWVALDDTEVLTACEARQAL